MGSDQIGSPSPASLVHVTITPFLWWASQVWSAGSGHRQLPRCWQLSPYGLPCAPSLLGHGTQVTRTQNGLASSCLSPVPQKAYRMFLVSRGMKIAKKRPSAVAGRLSTVISRKAIKMKEENQKRRPDSTNRESQEC